MSSYVPLVDLPYHAARVDAFVRYDQVPYFQQMYRQSLSVMPNMAIDIVVSLLCMAGVPLPLAVQLFLTLSILLFLAGCHWLARAIDRENVWIALPAAFLHYNSTFLYGYVNFNFATAVYLLLLAAWMRLRQRWTPFRIIGLSIPVALLYLCHLSGFGFFVVSTGFLTLWEWRLDRKNFTGAVLSMLPIVPAIVLHLTRSVRGQAENTLVTWDNWSKRLFQLSTPVLGYDMAASVIVIGLTALALAVVLWRTQWSVRWPTLALSGLFFLLFLAFPTEYFGASDAHVRFLLPGFLLALFSVSVTLGPLRKRAAIALTAAALAIRMTDIAVQWRTASRQLRDYAGILRKMEPNTSIYPVYWPDRDKETNKKERHFLHASSYAGPLRNAYVASEPRIEGQHIILNRHRNPWRDITPDMAPESIPWDTLLQGFDYVSTFRVSGPAAAQIARRAEEVGRSGPMTLYRLHRR